MSRLLMATVACAVVGGCAVAPPPSAEEIVKSPEIAPIAMSELITVEQPDPSSPGPAAAPVKPRPPADPASTETLFVTLEARLTEGVHNPGALSANSIAMITSDTQWLLSEALPSEAEMRTRHPRLASLHASLLSHLQAMGQNTSNPEELRQFAVGARESLRSLRERIPK